MTDQSSRELSQLDLSMYADEALEGAERTRVEHLISENEHYRRELERYAVEARVLASSIEDRASVDIPKFKRPLTLKGFAAANIATGLVIWLAQFLWKTLAGEVVVDLAARVTSVYLPDTYELFVNSLLYYIEEGTAMFEAYLSYVVFVVVVLVSIGALTWYRRHHGAISALLILSLSAGLAVPQESQALEIINNEDGVVTVKADEIIDDTVLAAAQAIRIEGRITGTVVAAAQTIEVLGSIDGNLIAAAQDITISGTVGQVVAGAGSSLTIDGGQIGGDIMFAGERLTSNAESAVSGNGVFAGATVKLNGSIDKDLYAAGELIELRGRVGDSVDTAAQRIWLMDEARIEGDLRWRSDNPDAITREDGVYIGGTVEQLAIPERLANASPYLSATFYLWQLAKFVSAVLVGLFLVWLFPSLRDLSIGSGGDALKSAAIGLVVMLSLPMIALLVALTIIGLPFGILGAMLWIAGLYLAHVILGIILGQMLMPDSESRVLPLVVGMGLVIVATNIPFIGPVVSFLLTIVGLGILALLLQRKFSQPALA